MARTVEAVDGIMGKVSPRTVSAKGKDLVLFDEVPTARIGNQAAKAQAKRVSGQRPDSTVVQVKDGKETIAWSVYEPGHSSIF